MAPVIGDLFQKSSVGEWEWRIPGFLSLPEKVDELYCSGEFSFSGACWYLAMWPNGQSKHESEGWVGLYLRRRDSGHPLTVGYTMGVRKTDGTKENIFESDSSTFPPPAYTTGWGYHKCLRRTDLVERRAELAPSELLTVIVTLKNDPRRSIEASMAGVKDIGRVVQTGQGTFHWEIAPFSEQEDVFKFWSPEFHLPESESTWMLTMYQKGTGDFSDRVLLALRRCRSQLANSRKPFHCTVGIKDADGEETPLGTQTHDLSVGEYILYPSSVSLGKDSEIDYVPSDTVTITLRFKVQEEIAVSQGVEKLHLDLKKLLESGAESDLLVVVSGREFRAHKNILRARSAIFDAMFEHDTVEKESGKVVIEDLDPDAFRDFLEYMYTGRVEVFSDENVFGLYASADKYDVQELKSETLEYMQRTLSVKSFCDVMSLVLLHEENDLTDRVVDFFKTNLPKIIVTVEWQIFMRDHNTAANELLIKALVPAEKK